MTGLQGRLSLSGLLAHCVVYDVLLGDDSGSFFLWRVVLWHT